ncbi:hypothetical protein GCM10009534_34810 [Kribbella sandramycini]|uniref:Transposase InsO family protein n=1 Tax=Kribbella sandramycini TaxID=60450 RepID=A0A841SB81_9ACTN|nr:transposase InsO family protein [Kribbella sandramycini]
MRKIIAKHPGHLVHVDVKKTGRIPDGGGWRAFGRGSSEANAIAHQTRGISAGYVYLHSAIDGHTRSAYADALENEQASAAVAFLDRARIWLAQHGIVKIERIITDNGSCYRSSAFADALDGAEHRRTKPYMPKHKGKVERYNRILAEEFLHVRTWTRGPARERLGDVEPALQLPPAPRRPPRETAGISDTGTRHQGPRLLQLAVSEILTASAVRSSRGQNTGPSQSGAR